MIDSLWQRLRGNIRFYVLAFSAILAAGVYVWVTTTIPSGSLQTIRLTQIYAFLALIYLYFSLLASPLTQIFKFLPYRGEYLRARRAIGVSAFFFALLHAMFAFFGQLGGFSGLAFLDAKYLWAVIFGFLALLILTLMAITAFDKMVEKLGYKWWKLLHRFVYLAGVLTLVHTFMLGTHFSDLSTAIPRATFVALIFLLGLEAIRVDKYLCNRWPGLSYFGVASMFVIHIIMIGLGYFLGASTLSQGGGLNLGVHAQHLQLAKQAQQAATNSQNNPNPSLRGDATKRYTVSFLHADQVTPGTDTSLSFQVFDASSGLPAPGFTTLYTKPAHLVIVDNEMTHYSHIHPSASGSSFTVTTNFPKADSYHLYLNYQPIGAIEQQVGFTLNVGDASNAGLSSQAIDASRTKTFGDYQVSIDGLEYNAAKLSVGQQTIKFTVKDSNGHDVATLKPYLGAFGHLVMINQKTYDYIHVHPNSLQTPPPDASSGPTVEFLPLGLYGPIKPGAYRVFAQLNPNDQLITADFTVKVD